MNFVLGDASLDEPKGAPTNVAHVRVDIQEDLIPEFSPDEIFVFLNKLVMKKVPDDTSLSSQFCMIQREEIFLHEYHIHPQYIRVDVEVAEQDIHDFMTSVLKKHPLTSSAPNVIALPFPWSTQKNSFFISTDRSFQKKVSVLELYELFNSSPNMKKITRAVTWRNAYSLIVTLDLEALPINPAFVSKAYQVFKTLQKEKLQVLHATFLFTPTEVDPQLEMLSQEVQPEEPLTPNRTQSIPSSISFAFAPLCVAFKHVFQSAALLGTVHSIKAAPPSEIPSKFPFSSGHAWKIEYQQKMSAWLVHDEVVNSIKFLTPKFNALAMHKALSEHPSLEPWHAKLALAKTLGSIEALNYATSGPAIPFDVSPIKHTSSSPSSPAPTLTPPAELDKSCVHQPYITAPSDTLQGAAPKVVHSISHPEEDKRTSTHPTDQARQPQHLPLHNHPLTPTHNLQSAQEANLLRKVSQGARGLVKLCLLQRTPNLPLLHNIPPRMHLVLKILPSLSKWTWIKLHTRMPQPKRQIRLHQAIPRVRFVKSHHAT